VPVFWGSFEREKDDLEHYTIQCTTVKVSKVSEEKAAARLKSHLKYLQYRQRNREPEQTKDCHFFNDHSDHVDRCRILQSIMHGQIGNVYYYSLRFLPTHDEPVNNWRQWTRAILGDVEDQFEQTLNWYAVQHSAIDHPHIHVIVPGTGKDRKTGHIRSVIFRAQDFVYLRERGRAHSEYELQGFLMKIVRELDQYDIMINDALS
jgi:hypothetical protein